MASQLCLDSKQIDQIVYNTYTFLLKQKQQNAENANTSNSPTSNTTVPADATNSSTTNNNEQNNSNNSSSFGQNTMNNKTVKLTPLERAISSNAIPPPRVSYRDINMYPSCF